MRLIVLVCLLVSSLGLAHDEPAEQPSPPSAQNSHSPALNYNLGAGYWELNQPAKASWFLLQSIRYTANPLESYARTQLLSQIENEIGMKDGFASTFTFYALALATDSVLAALLLLALISFCALLIYRFKRRHTTPPLLSVGLFLFPFLAVGTLLLHYYRSRVFEELGVIAGSAEVKVLNHADASRAEVLIELPPGTLVRVLKTGNPSSEIFFPISGWVPSADLLQNANPPPASLESNVKTD